MELFAGAAHPALLLAAALLLQSVLGVLVGGALTRPDRLFGTLAGSLARRLDRPRRGAAALFVRGLLASILVVGLVGLLALVADRWASGQPFGWAAVLALMVVLLPFGSIAWGLRRIARAAKGGRLDETARVFALVHRRRAERRDVPGVLRAAIEAASADFVDLVATPVFWYALLGLPGMAASLAAVASARALDRRPQSAYARFPRAVRGGLVAIPGAIACGLVIVAALVAAGGGPWRAIGVLRRDRRSADPWLIAAMAGALGLSLGGPRDGAGGSEVRPWINQGGRAQAVAGDLARASLLLTIVAVLTVGLAAAAAWVTLVV